MGERRRVEMTYAELRATAVALTAMGILIGWGLFGAPQFLEFALDKSKASDWATVVVGLISAIAVLYLGLQANRLAKTPQQLQEADRKREATFLLAYLYAEIQAVRASSHGFIATMQGQQALAFLLVKPESRKIILDNLDGLDMPLARQALPRLHVLEPRCGDALAKVMRGVQSARLAMASIIRMTPDEEGLRRLEIYLILMSSIQANAIVVMECAHEAGVVE
jgi:hypothetical protein